MKEKRLSALVIFALLIVVVAAVMTACGEKDGVFVLEEYSISFSGGKAVFTWAGKGAFEVYGSKTEDGELTKITDVKNEKTYSTANYADYLVFKADGRETARFSYLYDSLGDNVKIFSQRDTQQQIQEYIEKIYSRMAWDEFSQKREAMLFMPGEYADVTAYVGYFTSVAGLGYDPTSTSIGNLEVRDAIISSSSLVNFWRTIENLEVQCNEKDARWLVSQATSMRRMNIMGDLYVSESTWGSGGFISDSKIDGTIHARRDSTNEEFQQQWFTRNSTFQYFNGGQMNMVFVGTNGDLKNLAAHRAVEIEKTQFVREKPYVVFDNQKGFGVYLPDWRYEAKGNSWEDEPSGGTFIPLSKFYVGRAEVDTDVTLNAALADGKHLLLSPGIYKLNKPLAIERKDTIVTGLGLASLTVSDTNTEGAIVVGDVDGVNISSLLFDAGRHSDSLIRVGKEKTDVRHDRNPICIADLFFRSYGANVWVDQTVVINANDVFGDNFWMWRADHTLDVVGKPEDGRYYKNAGGSWVKAFNVSWGGGGGYGTRENNKGSYGRNGVVVNGDDVTMYGLMVEHYQEYQTIWNGERGFLCFYQCETPYDAPNQAAWTNPAFAGNLSQGWAGYKIGDHVKEHTAYGLGVYYVNNTQQIKVQSHGIEAPSGNGIVISNMVTARFAGSNLDKCGPRNVLYLTDTNKIYGESAIKGEGGADKQYLRGLRDGVVYNQNNAIATAK